VERSDAVRQAYLTFLEHLASGPGEWVDRLTLTGEATAHVGSAPPDWWTGAATAESWTWAANAMRTTRIRLVPGDAEAYAEGTIGWVIDRPTFSNRNGGETETRVTALFRWDTESWKLVLFHNSIAVPDAQVEAFRDLA
jgi:hypothetical protein